MAASSKEDKLASSFRQRLEHLGCPYTDNVDDSWIMELIFTPGEPRIRLLQWIFSKFDSQLNELLDPQFTVMTDSKMDSRIQRLLFVASTLGLCASDDADLIRGCTSSGKQAAFMDQLLDLVCIVDEAEQPIGQELSAMDTYSAQVGIEEQFARDCFFLDSLTDDYRVDRLFTTDAKLLPPDIMRQVERRWEEQGHQDKESLPVPDLSKLADQGKTLAKKLELQTNNLQELKKKYSYPEHDLQATAKVNTTLRLVLSELSQLIVGFSYCFENEMKSWCNKVPPKFTQLGPAFKRIHTLLQQFVMLLQGLGAVRSSYTNLTTGMRQRIHQITTKEESRQQLDESTLSALEGIQGCVDILEESLLNATVSGVGDTSIRSAVSVPRVEVD